MRVDKLAPLSVIIEDRMPGLYALHAHEPHRPWWHPCPGGRGPADGRSPGKKPPGPGPRSAGAGTDCAITQSLDAVSKTRDARPALWGFPGRLFVQAWSTAIRWSGEATAEQSVVSRASCIVHRCCPRSSPLRPPPQRGETPHHPAALRFMGPDLVVLMPTKHP